MLPMPIAQIGSAKMKTDQINIQNSVETHKNKRICRVPEVKKYKKCQPQRTRQMWVSIVMRWSRSAVNKKEENDKEAEENIGKYHDYISFSLSCVGLWFSWPLPSLLNEGVCRPKMIRMCIGKTDQPALQ